MNVILTHPKCVAKDKKIDTKNSKGVADLFKYNPLILPKSIREVKGVAKYQCKLIAMKVIAKSHLEQQDYLSY